MKRLLLVCFIVLTVYLNRTYAHIYDLIKGSNLPNPTTQKYFEFKNVESSTTVKYVALGDSLSTGVGSNSFQESFPYIYAQNLSRSSSVVLVNLAKPGAKSIDVLTTQLPQAIKENPQEITLLIGTNDIHDFKSTEYFAENYRLIIKELKTKTKAKITLLNIPDLGSSLLLYPPYNLLSDFRTGQYNEYIKKIAQEEDVKMVNLYDFTKEVTKKLPEFYSLDQFHPSGEGYKIWGQMINAN